MKRCLVFVVTIAMLAIATAANAGEGGEPAPDSVGLTFDDGPHPRWTPIVLDILDEYGVKATFFVQGWKVEEYPEIAREIVERGHSIQVHGYGHATFTDMSDVRITESLRGTMNAIYGATGVRATCVRPPYGAHNARVERVADEVGLVMVMWDFNSLDTSLQSSSGVFRQTIRAQAGDNILAHDTWGSIWQYALPKVIEEFQARGYGFDIVCENLGPRLSYPRLIRPGIGII